MKAIHFLFTLILSIALLSACKNEENKDKQTATPQKNKEAIASPDLKAWSEEVLDAFLDKEYRTLEKYAAHPFTYSGRNPDRLNSVPDQIPAHLHEYWDGEIKEVVFHHNQDPPKAYAIYHQQPGKSFALSWEQRDGEWKFIYLEDLTK